jgi:SOS-response transcriptional repressor LexA
MPNRPILPPGQAVILWTIRQMLRERPKRERPPSLHEIRKAVGAKNLTPVYRAIRQLEKKGYLKRTPDEDRSLQVVE